MTCWIYKCNSRNRSHQVTYGDWDRFFTDPGNGQWGSTEWVPKLAKAHHGDVILAYQTDRNELVGIAEVIALRRRGSYKDLILRPLEELRVKVRPLKKQSIAIARIPALQPGPIQTLYSISEADFNRLLHAAGTRYMSAAPRPTAEPRAIECLCTETVSYVRGRSRQLRDLALQNARGICEVCRVNFGRVFGGKGVRVLQVHHRKQLSATDSPRVTRLRDLAVLCANCHLLIHMDPDRAMPVEQLRRILRREDKFVRRQG